MSYILVPGLHEFAALHCGDPRLTRFEADFLFDMLRRSRPRRTHAITHKQARIFHQIRDGLLAPRVDPIEFIDALSDFDAAMDNITNCDAVREAVNTYASDMPEADRAKLLNVIEEAVTYVPASGVLPRPYDGP